MVIVFKTLRRVVYQVDDLEPARDWYAKILGSQPLFDSPVAVIFQVGDCTLSLARPQPGDMVRRGGAETYWEVDDINAAHQRLLDAGAGQISPVQEILNVMIAKVRDPFGNFIGLTSHMADPGQRTVDKRASETALKVCFCRALASRDERDPIRGPDTMAELFLDAESRTILASTAARSWVIQNRISPPLYGYFIARTRYFDELFVDALDRALPQIVLLGAGYDTRPYRFAKRLGRTRVYEVDVATTQAHKRSLLAAGAVAVPPQLAFVTMNFWTDDYAQALAQAGFDSRARTLFVWEGVSYYLVEADVLRTLRFVSSGAAAGSLIGFDYLSEKTESVSAAEPFRFWLQREQMQTLLEREDFCVQEQMGPEELARRFLRLEDGSQAEPTLDRFALMLARVRERDRGDHGRA